MKITIEIPKEFEKHFNEDRFKDSLERVITDVNYQIKKELSISGNYEIETLEMLINAFKTAKLVKCGRWIKIDQYHFKCSECGASEHVKFYPLDEHKFCWHCGAQMDGD